MSQNTGNCLLHGLQVAAFAGLIFGTGIGKRLCYLHFDLLLSLPTDGGFYEMKAIASQTVFVWDVNGSWVLFLAIKYVTGLAPSSFS